MQYVGNGAKDRKTKDTVVKCDALTRLHAFACPMLKQPTSHGLGKVSYYVEAMLVILN